MVDHDNICTRCKGQKEPQRVGRYSYCLKCQYVFTAASSKRHPYKNFTPEKRQQTRCRYLVAEAIKKGLLTRLPCEVCKTSPSEAHHEDYSKPLEVKWLCRKHHFEIHGRKPKKRKHPVSDSKPQNTPILQVSRSVILEALNAELAAVVHRYRHWENLPKPELSKTVLEQKERLFRKHLIVLKNAIQAVTKLGWHSS